MKNLRKTSTFTGIFYISVFVLGILSITPAIDHPDYLVKAAANVNAIYGNAAAQLALVPVYIIIGVLLYPILKQSNKYLAKRYLLFRITTALFLVTGVLSMFEILKLSQEFVAKGMIDLGYFRELGNTLQRQRDLNNHVWMVISITISNLMMNIILFKERWVPRWLTVWGFSGAVLTIGASILVWSKYLNVLTPAYLLLNVPIGLQEITFAFWLIIMGFNLSNTVSSERP